MIKKQKKYFVLSFFISTMLITMLFLEDSKAITERAVGIIFIGLALLFAFNLLSDKLLFTPLLFPSVYLLFFGLYQLKLRTNMGQMQFEMKFVIVCAMVYWLMRACTCAIGFQGGKLQLLKTELNRVKFKRIIYFIAPCSIFAMLYEWFRAGGIPALQSNAETFRMQVSQSASIHTIAIAIKIIALLILAFWILQPQKRAKDKGLIIIFLLALLLMLGTANRGELLFIPVVGFLIYSIVKPPSKKLIITIGVSVLLVLSVYPVVRGYTLYGNAFLRDYEQISVYPQLAIFMPLYNTLAYAFEILNRLTMTFPDIVPHGLGEYSIFCYIPFLDMGQELWVVQNEVWQNGFYGALTSTFLGSWYADFGYFGCFLGTFLFCELSVWQYKRLLSKRDFTDLVLYAYTFYLVLIGSYSNSFNFVFVCYYLLIFIVLNYAKQKNQSFSR